MSRIEYSFRFHPLFVLPALLVGVRSSTARVVVDGEELRAEFGPWTLRTTLDNVAGAEVTGPYAWPKVIGPPHLSFADRGLTMATNPDRGACIRFRRTVPGIDPLAVIRHPSVTVTVADAPALVELLDRRSHDERRVHLTDEDVDAGTLVESARDELASLSAAELRARARARRIEKVSRMSKAELIAALSPDPSAAR